MQLTYLLITCTNLNYLQHLALLWHKKSGSHMTNNGIQKCEHIFKCLLEIHFKHHEIKNSGNVPI